jgi:hypothetical protein
MVAEKFVITVQNCPCRKLLGRSGTSLNSGEDDEFSWVACELGFGKGLFPELKIKHLIDRRRVAKSYMLALARGHAFSRALLYHLHGLPVALPASRPGVADILANLFRARLMIALRHANAWRRGWSEPLVETALYDAKRSGIELALEKISGLPSAEIN